jgi:hypothetical protein
MDGMGWDAKLHVPRLLQFQLSRISYQFAIIIIIITTTVLPLGIFIMSHRLSSCQRLDLNY